MTINQASTIEAVTNSMLKIPEGKIILRDDRINKQWTTAIKPFLLSKYLVTQALYVELTNQNPSEFKGAKRPVECISWFDAVEFCNLLSQRFRLISCYAIDKEVEKVKFNTAANGFRLPTEAEWEYACKADSNAIRYGDLDSISWYKENSNGQTHEVGQKEPNSWGLYDMLGNVWEWCSDIYDETVYGSYRVFRGGGWNDNERGCLATNRRRSHPIALKIDDLGFRVARNFSCFSKSINDESDY